MTPWHNSPYSLVSLYEMLKFAAASFVHVTRQLAELKHLYATVPARQLISQPPSTPRTAADILHRLKQECHAIGLSMAEMQIDRMLHGLIQTNCTYGAFRGFIEELQNRIADQLTTKLILYIPDTKASYIASPRDAWEDSILSKFPSIAKEIDEAAKCYGTGRNTACVFHLMRILEAGLNSLAKVFNVPFQHANWEQVLNQVEKKIKDISTSPTKPSNWKEDQQFYSESASQFRYFKDAWRNYAMHLHERYDEGQTLSIYNHVREFMSHLSKRFSE